MIKNLKIPISSPQEQILIVKKIDELFNKYKIIKKTVTDNKENLETMEKSILAMAFRGKLTKQNPKEETATELIKRFKEKNKMN